MGEWFALTVIGHLVPGTNSSSITVLQDQTAIISFIGNAGNGGLMFMHFGLYTGQKQTTFAVYNDNIGIWNLGA